MVMTFFIGIVYALIPCSLWRKHHSRRWRTAILLTCIPGFGMIALGVILELILVWSSDEVPMMHSGSTSMFFALLAGFVFLPLACFGSIHSLISTVRERKLRKEIE